MAQTVLQPNLPAAATPSSSTIPKFEQLPESKYELDWADLVTLDLSQFDTSGGKQRLAEQLKDAVHRVGFFYIVNFGLTQDEIDHQFAIGREVFKLPEEEKLKHRADLANGNYNGYRPLGSIELFPGIKDNIEMYNIFKFNSLTDRSHPDIIKENIAEIERIHRFIHGEIIRKLLTLIAIILEVPEDYFVNTHQYNGNSDCHLRYQMYRARTSEENAKAQNIYSRGHTDFGSLTLLFRQPVSALQILSPDGTWKYVKPHPGSITVNIADALQFWSNGYLKSSVHRVVAPPADQAHLDRLGVLFFLRPEAGLDLKPIESPLLKKLGLNEKDESTDGIKAGEWVRARVQGNWDAPPVEGQKEKVVLGNAKAKIYE